MRRALKLKQMVGENWHYIETFLAQGKSKKDRNHDVFPWRYHGVCLPLLHLFVSAVPVSPCKSGPSSPFSPASSTWRQWGWRPFDDQLMSTKQSAVQLINFSVVCMCVFMLKPNRVARTVWYVFVSSSSSPAYSQGRMSCAKHVWK